MKDDKNELNGWDSLLDNCSVPHQIKVSHEALSKVVKNIANQQSNSIEKVKELFSDEIQRKDISSVLHGFIPAKASSNALSTIANNIANQSKETSSMFEELFYNQFKPPKK